MKNRIISLLFAATLFALPSLASANIGKVTNLSAAGSSVIVVPGGTLKLLIIQNNGANSVRLSLDGGAGYLNPQSGLRGTNPTPTTGYLLTAGQQLIISSDTSQPAALHAPIVAIMVTGTTTIDIVTDDTASTFPTT